MKAPIFKIVIALSALILLQWFLQGWLLTLALLLLGTGMAFWFGGEKNYLLKVFTAQLLISLLLLALTFGIGNDFRDLIRNSSVSATVWGAAVLLINTLTVFFCLAVPFHILTLWQRRQPEASPVTG